MDSKEVAVLNPDPRNEGEGIGVREGIVSASGCFGTGGEACRFVGDASPAVGNRPKVGPRILGGGFVE